MITGGNHVITSQLFPQNGISHVNNTNHVKCIWHDHKSSNSKRKFRIFKSVLIKALSLLDSNYLTVLVSGI